MVGTGATDHYSVLGVPRDASTDEVKRAYRARASLFHPSKAIDLDEAGRIGRMRQVAALNAARKVLMCPRQRRAYDLWLQPDQELQATDDEKAAEGTQVSLPHVVEDLEDFDFDFSGDGRPYRFARGKAARVGNPERLRFATAQLRGEEPMDLGERDGRVRHIGPLSPFGGMGECGHANCRAHRLKFPEVRADFRDFLLSKVREAVDAGWWGDGGFCYASLGSGELLFDLELLERIRAAGVRIAQVCLIDCEYLEPRVDAKAALREFADWQRASAQRDEVASCEIFAFGKLGDFYEAANEGGRVAGCHLLVHCDANWGGCVEDSERLALQALTCGGMLARLTNHEVEAHDPSGKRRCSFHSGPFVGDRYWERRPQQSCHSSAPFSAAAWIKMPGLSGGPPMLNPVEDPYLVESARSMLRERANNEHFSIWRVVHNPRVAVRAKPHSRAAVVGVFYTGDEVMVLGKKADDGWLRIHDTTIFADEPEEAWVLCDGESVGLGKLLEEVVT